MSEIQTPNGPVQALIDPLGEWSPMWIDFDRGDLARRLDSLGRQPGLLGRALYGRERNVRFRIFDACMGLGSDAATFLLWGHQVETWEVLPEVHAIVVDGFRRTQRWSPEELAKSLSVRLGDSISRLGSAEVDVIYIDPIFPVPTRGSALPSKGLQWLRAIEAGGASREELLLAAAANPHAQRLVVKGTTRDKAGLPPSLVDQRIWSSQRVENEAVRYDIFSRKRSGHSIAE